MLSKAPKMGGWGNEESFFDLKVLYGSSKQLLGGGVSLCGWSPVQQDLTEKENVLLFVSSEAVESYPVKLEKSHTVMLPPTVSVLWYVHQNNHLPIFNEF